MLEYKIVKKAQFTVVGIARQFNNVSSYAEIPKFWQWHAKSDLKEDICGTYGICIDDGGEDEFTYYIADDYIPWLDYPANVQIKVIPEHTWAVFPCHGALPETLQSVNTEIWKEWLPSNKKYRLADKFNIELYSHPCEQPEDDYSEIWLPVTEIK